MTGPFYLEDGGANTSPSWETDGAPGINTATLLLFAVDGFVTGIRYYAGATGDYTLALWQGSTSGPLAAGTLLASVVHTAASIGWQIAALDEPVAVSAGVPYVASRWHPTGYGFVASFFSASHGALTQGDPVYAPSSDEDITAVLDAEYDAGWPTSGSTGRFTIADPPQWPATGGGSAYYGVDAEFYTELPGGEQHSGTAAYGITLTLAASGRKRARGSAAFALNLSLSAPSAVVEPGDPLTASGSNPSGLTAGSSASTLVASGRP